MFYLYAYLRMHDTGAAKVAIVAQSEDPFELTERMIDEIASGMDVMYAIFSNTVMVDAPSEQIDYDDMIKRVTDGNQE